MVLNLRALPLPQVGFIRTALELLAVGVALASVAAVSPASFEVSNLAAPQNRSFTLYVREGTITAPDGTEVYMWGFTDDPNGVAKIPGPIIEVNEGDEVAVTLINDRDPSATPLLLNGEGHTVHLHGLDTSSEFDGVPETHEAGLVRQGGSFTYRFTAKHAGTYWYHCHQNNVQHQQMGMYGPLVVHAAGGARNAYTGGPAFDREYALVFSEITMPGHEAALAGVREGAEPFVWTDYTPTYYLINDRAFDDPQTVATSLTARPGERVLVRVIDAGYAAHQVFSPGQPFAIVGSDGRPFPNTPPTSSLWFGPGEKYDLLFTADASGAIRLQDRVRDPFNGPVPGAEKLTLAAPRPATNETRSFTLYVRPALQTMPDGALVPGYGFTDDPTGQGQIPGPELTAPAGAQVEVTLMNDADPSGSDHGLLFPGLGDQVRGPALIPPGGSGTYTFRASHAGGYLYRGASDEDLQMGMYGALILKPGDGSQSTYAGGPAYDRGYTMVLSELESDARARIQQGAGFDASTYTPNYFLMNGRAYADTLADASSVLRADLDQRVLIQVVNAGLTPHSMHLHGYHFQIVGRQGRPWPNGPLKDTVLVAPGDAYDLIYVSDQRGTFPFHDHYEFANTNNGVWMGGMLTLAFCPLPEEGSGELVALPGSAALAAVVDEPVAVEAPAASGPSIFIRDNFYAPNTLTVPAGTTVRWEHQGKVQHTVTALLGIFDSGPLNGGEVFTFTFDRPGRYDFFCRFHITNRGTITVQ